MDALGQSEAFLQFNERLSAVAKVERPVLIVGERGTGKELAASRLHYLSQRWGKPFITLNCSTLSHSLLESELFGYEAGAFTGALKRRSGRFEAAHEGTLFLDEIGNLSLTVQEKILRVVEYGTFERVGGAESVSVNVRILGATNANLPRLVQENKFMPDLLDRLAFEVLYLPPLKNRQEDIPLLANHFAAQMAHELGQGSAPLFSGEALTKLRHYPWPGNIRELKNVVERAVYLEKTDTIRKIIFNPFAIGQTQQQIIQQEEFPIAHRHNVENIAGNPINNGGKDQVNELLPFPEKIATYKKLLLNTALETSEFNQKKAARSLGLTYNQFRGLYRKFNPIR